MMEMSEIEAKLTIPSRPPSISTPNYLLSLSRIARYRETISAIPPLRLLRAMGFLVSQHGQLDAIAPPPFLGVSFLENMRRWRCDNPPPQKGYLSDTCVIPYENKANGCDTPLCDTLSKGYCAIWGASRTGPLSAYPLTQN